MNTKYPLNGRLATLADLVYEYGPYSGWPSEKNYDLLNIKENSKQPFQTLIFKSNLDLNNKFVAEIPYEIVYFDDIYSTTEKDDSGKLMKLIQKNDTSTFYTSNETELYGQLGPSSYIIADIVTNPTKIKNGYFGFKFIGANIDKQSINSNQYYYNYRTSSGEATVMYAFRNILQLLKDMTDNKINDNRKKHFINSIFSDYNNITDYENDNINIDEQLTYILDNNTKDDFSKWTLNPDAYKYLGDAIWTAKHIYYANYTTVKNNEYVPDIIKKAITADYFNGAITSFNDLNKSIRNILGINTNDAKKYYSYNSTNSIYRKLLYFFDLFLNSQRFFISFVTSFSFSKISNKSYLQKDPVLRCDLGIQRLYEYITILSAVHDWQTALPAGEMTYETSINVIIQYKIKYKNVEQQSNIITTTLGPISFDDIRKYRNPINNKTGKENDIWYALKTYPGNDSKNIPEEIDQNLHGESITDGMYSENTILYGSKYFPALKHKDFENSTNSYIISKVNYSLGTLTWPIGEKLKIESLDDFNKSINNPNFFNNTTNSYNYADTTDVKLFSDDNKPEQLIKNGIGPFGTLRIHTSLDLSNENKKSSSIYFDINLYRCKNYFYEPNDSTTSEEATVFAYFMPKYKDDIPFIQLPIVKLKNDETNNTLNNVIANLNNIYNGGNGNVYSIPSNGTITTYFTVQSGTGRNITYASGSTSFQANLDSSTYTNKKDLMFSYFDNNTWKQESNTDNINIVTHDNTTTTDDQYEITFNFNNNYHQYWRFTLSDINYSYYFRCNYNKTGNTMLNVSITHILVSNDSLNNKMVEYKLGMIDKNNGEMSLKYAIYNITNNQNITNDNNDNDNDISSLSIIEHAIDDTTKDNIYVKKNSNIYIQPIAVKLPDNKYMSNKIDADFSFYIAYKTSMASNNINIYNFNQCKLFDPINQSLVLINASSQNTLNIYLAFEPIYIINNGSISASDDKNNNITTDYKTYFTNDTCTLLNIKFNNQTIEKEEGKLNSNFIKSIYADYVYIQADSICIDNSNNKTLETFIQDTSIKEKYLFEFNIIKYMYNNDNGNYNQQLMTTVSNNTTLDELNNSLNNKNNGFIGNNQYYIGIEINKFKKKLEMYTITVKSSLANVNIDNTYYKITIIKLPTDYNDGNIQEGDPYNSNMQLPKGTKVRVENKYNWENSNYNFTGFSINQGNKNTAPFEIEVNSNIEIYMNIEERSIPTVTIDSSQTDSELTVTLSIQGDNQNMVIKYITVAENDTTSEPTKDSSTYDNPLKFQETTTIVARCYNQSTDKLGSSTRKTCSLSLGNN